jgi:Fe-Mn family superoxide dismutase
MLSYTNDYRRIKLPYQLNELEPVIYFQTMQNHYIILHKNYEDKLNEILQRFELNEKFSSLKNLMENLEKVPIELREDVRFFGGGLINHNFFFTHLGKFHPNNNTEGIINHNLLKKIQKNFSNLERLKKELIKNSLKIPGSG